MIVLMHTLDCTTVVTDGIHRLEYSSMSDQELMEILFAGLSDKYLENRKDPNGTYRDVCEWHKNIKCDADKCVVSIVCEIYDVKLPLDYLPPKLEVFSLLNETGWCEFYDDERDFKCEGTLDIARLPSNIRVFDIGNNYFKGSLELAQMPPKLVDFVVRRNDFIGSCDLTHLSANLARCDLSWNRFCGSISLEILPSSLITLALHHNKFSGELNLACLPERLGTLSISNNTFLGSFVLDQRNSPIHIDAHSNSFSGTAVIVSCADVHVFLGNQKGQDPVILDENGDDHERKSAFLGGDYAKASDHAVAWCRSFVVQSNDPSMICAERIMDPDQLKLQILLSGLEFHFLKEMRDSNFMPQKIDANYCFQFDENDRVVSIYLQLKRGTLYLEFIPPLVKLLVVRPDDEQHHRCDASGKLSLRKLPRGMEVFQIANCSFFGVVELTQLPPTMLSFIVADNFLGGSCDLTALPRNLERCLLHENNFTGAINLLTFPHSLVELSLHENKLVGNVIIGRLPENLRVLSVSSNQFCGSLAITHPIAPKTKNNRLKLWAHDNFFIGTLMIHRKAQVKLRIDYLKFTAVVDENGELCRKFPGMSALKQVEPEFELITSAPFDDPRDLDDWNCFEDSESESEYEDTFTYLLAKGYNP